MSWLAPIIELTPDLLRHHRAHVAVPAGRFPFANSLDAELNPAEAVQAMFQRILRADFIPLTWISPLCAELLALLLCVDPAQRITMDQLLCHPWFVDGAPASRTQQDFGVTVQPGEQGMEAPRCKPAVPDPACGAPAVQSWGVDVTTFSRGKGSVRGMIGTLWIAGHLTSKGLSGMQGCPSDPLSLC